MASSDDIAAVRENTDEPTEENFSDESIGALIDAYGVMESSEIVWTRKAARYAKLVNTSEAGASHSFSDLQRNALAMAKVYKDADEEGDALARSRPRVRKIVRL